MSERAPGDDGDVTDWATWIPSADSVNALPYRLRQYIQELHTMGDASVVHELAALRELHAALALRLATCTCGCSPGPVAYIPLGLLDHVRGPEASAQLQHLADLGWRTPDWMAVRVPAVAEAPASCMTFDMYAIMGGPAVDRLVADDGHNDGG